MITEEGKILLTGVALGLVIMTAVCQIADNIKAQNNTSPAMIEKAYSSGWNDALMFCDSLNTGKITFTKRIDGFDSVVVTHNKKAK